MKKIGKVFLIIIVVGVVLYAAYMFLLMPSGFTSETDVVQSFFDNQASENVCEKHFNPETLSLCETFVDGLEGEEYTIDNTVKLGDDLIVTITIGSTSDTFTFTFIEEEDDGLISFLNSTLYIIDTIE